MKITPWLIRGCLAVVTVGLLDLILGPYGVFRERHSVFEGFVGLLVLALAAFANVVCWSK